MKQQQRSKNEFHHFSSSGSAEHVGYNGKYAFNFSISLFSQVMLNVSKRYYDIRNLAGRKKNTINLKFDFPV